MGCRRPGLFGELQLVDAGRSVDFQRLEDLALVLGDLGARGPAERASTARDDDEQPDTSGVRSPGPRRRRTYRCGPHLAAWPAEGHTRLDDWAKDVAPSIELRTLYGHDRAKFDEFRRGTAPNYPSSAAERPPAGSGPTRRPGR